jgi:threonine dehydrogenase-like Zn-dependent dehydrogenase
MDLDDGRLRLAEEDGADIIINSKKGDAAKAVIELTNNLRSRCSD